MTWNSTANTWTASSNSCRLSWPTDPGPRLATGTVAPTQVHLQTTVPLWHPHEPAAQKRMSRISRRSCCESVFQAKWKPDWDKERSLARSMLVPAKWIYFLQSNASFFQMLELLRERSYRWSHSADGTLEVARIPYVFSPNRRGNHIWYIKILLLLGIFRTCFPLRSLWLLRRDTLTSSRCLEEIRLGMEQAKKERGASYRLL